MPRTAPVSGPIHRRLNNPILNAFVLHPLITMRNRPTQNQNRPSAIPGLGTGFRFVGYENVPPRKTAPTPSGLSSPELGRFFCFWKFDYVPRHCAGA
jgi:hypothetical protein